MAALSISISRGAAGTNGSDYTTGVLTPNAGDIELRFNTTDTNGKALTQKDVILALDMFKRQIEASKLGAFAAYILSP
jgi:hypothetical protein